MKQLFSLDALIVIIVWSKKNLFITKKIIKDLFLLLVSNMQQLVNIKYPKILQ